MKSLRFLEMLRQSILSGGRVVTFQDVDISDLADAISELVDVKNYKKEVGLCSDEENCEHWYEMCKCVHCGEAQPFNKTLGDLWNS